MSLFERIKEELTAATQADDSVRLSTLRLIKAMLKDQAISNQFDDDRGFDDEKAMVLLSKMIKQRQESAHSYEESGRLGLAERERKEIEVIEDFLPSPLSRAEVDEVIENAIKQVGASSVRDMGKIMAALKANYNRRMNFGEVGKKIKDYLSQ